MKELELTIKLTEAEYKALDKAIYVAIRDAVTDVKNLSTLQRKVWDAKIDSEEEEW